MTGKFDNVSVEKDTKIIFSQQMMFGEYDILYQKWFWDGIYGESMIFLSEDVLSISDEELLNEIKSSPIVKEVDKITMTKSKNGFTFYNFNFEIA